MANKKSRTDAQLGRQYWHYVYQLVDPRNGEIFYIGKGRFERIFQHEIEARRGLQTRKC